MATTDFEQIEKETISDLKFPANEVLTENESLSKRNTFLCRALSPGNLEHSKIKIYFEDKDSQKVVETTVWALTDKRVILKQVMGIPISPIHSIKL